GRARAPARARAAPRRSAPALSAPRTSTAPFSSNWLAQRLSPVGLLAQLALQHLAAGVARQRILAYSDELRDLEVGQTRAAVLEHGVDLERCPGRGHDHGADLLAHHLVGHAHGCRLAH